MIKIDNIRVEYNGASVVLNDGHSMIMLTSAASMLALSETLRICGKQVEESEMAAHIRMYARRTPP